MKEVQIFDKVNVFCLQASEAQFLAKEVDEYLKHEVHLPEQAVVFDVGANIGIFALHLLHYLPQSISIYSFEPIPAIFTVLQQNAQRIAPQSLIPLPYGLSNVARSTTFTYYPKATVWSTAYPDLAFAQRAQTKLATLRSLEDAPRWLRLVPQQIWSWLIEFVLQRVLRKTQRVACTLKTLSESIEELQVDRIDLLKIDVEYAELEVLQGIERQDWHKIKQVVMEVHDLNDRLSKVIALISENGFQRIITEQQHLLQGSNIFLVYAFKE
jgi:FkbM family methyltransferase